MNSKHETESERQLHLELFKIAFQLDNNHAVASADCQNIEKIINYTSSNRISSHYIITVENSSLISNIPLLAEYLVTINNKQKL